MATIPMEDLLRLMLEEGASDLHLTVGAPPVLRLDGSITKLNAAPLTAEDTETLVKAITSEFNLQRIAEGGTADFGLSFQDKARFRVSAFHQRGNFALAVRLIPARLMSLEEIGMPPVVSELIRRPRGLVLVTGPTGSGKTTSLATLIDQINSSAPGHIVTIEDPIEYFHGHKMGIVNQREIGVDVPTFGEALRRVLRQDPDVILVGEMRDQETMEAAITAAETGHLVFSTLHTTGAARTVDRIIDSFPEEKQEQIRVQLASNLMGVISQILLPRQGKPGRVAAFEVMVSTPSIAALIRDNKTFRISNDILTGTKYGMVSLDASLADLYLRDEIGYSEALEKAQDPEVIAQLMGGPATE